MTDEYFMKDDCGNIHCMMINELEKKLSKNGKVVHMQNRVKQDISIYKKYLKKRSGIWRSRMPKEIKRMLTEELASLLVYDIL